MNLIPVLALYLLLGLLTVAITARHLDLDPHDDADVAAAVGILLFWPLAATFMSLGFAVSLVIRAARDKR